MKAWMTHNPKCETSRNVLALLQERGIEPDIREYLKQPLTRTGEPEQQKVRWTFCPANAVLAKEMGVPVRDVVGWSEPGSSGRSSGPSAVSRKSRTSSGGSARRTNAAAGKARAAEKEVAAAGITPDLADAALLDAMAARPVLLNRPIVRTSKGLKVCRPSETVEGML